MFDFTLTREAVAAIDALETGVRGGPEPDRITLELLLTAGPSMNGNRTLEDKYLSAVIGAAEMVLKGCTAAYDLAAEFPMPTLEGLEAIGRAYADVGMRAVLAPMVADISFFEAIPGLMPRLSPALQKEVERFRLAPHKASVQQMKKALHKWKLGQVSLAVALGLARCPPQQMQRLAKPAHPRVGKADVV